MKCRRGKDKKENTKKENTKKENTKKEKELLIFHEWKKAVLLSGLHM